MSQAINIAVTVNGEETVRKLTPYAYKEAVKTLDKSNEARVTIDGERVFRSAVTSGKDVKSGSGLLKCHVYFYRTEAAAVARDYAGRDWMPISIEEFRAYKHDPGYVIAITTVKAEQAPAEPEQAPAEQTKKGRKAARVAA